VLLVSFEFPCLRLYLFLQGLFWEGTDAPLLTTGSSRAWEMESVVVLASVREDAEGLVRKVALLEGELAEARQAREVAEDKVRNMSSSSVEGAR
jgi:hypothetical protein